MKTLKPQNTPFLTFTLMILLLAGCASGIKTAPPSADYLQSLHKSLKSKDFIAEQKLELKNLEGVKKEELWTQIFLTGQAQEEKDYRNQACESFQTLQLQDFPLKALLNFKLLSNCSFSQKELTELLNETEKLLKPYQEEVFYNLAHKLALNHNLSQQAGYYLGHLALYEKTSEKKTSLTQKALELVADKEDHKKNLTEQLETVAPRFIPSPTKEQWYKVARDYERNRKFRRARDYYQKIIDHDDISYEEKVKAWYRLAMSFKVGRDRNGYTEKLMDLVAWIGKQIEEDSSEEFIKDYFKYQILVARSYWTLQNSKKAMSILEDLANHPHAHGSHLAHVLWLKGSINLEWKKYDEAIIEFQKAFNETLEEDEMLVRISWSLPWAFYNKGKYELAVHYYKESLKKISDGFDQLKFKYWMAKSLLKLKNKEEADTYFKEIADSSPYGYYGILSRKELGMHYAPLNSSTALPRAKDYELQWLLSLDQQELAKSNLKIKAKELKKDEKHDQLLAYLPYFIQAEDYAGAMHGYFSIPSDKRFTHKDRYYTLLFPTPFLEEVKGAANKFKLSSSFIYSIMRQESAFDHQARSWADAFGLLQLLPERAEELSKKAGVKYQKYTDLFHPETNIKLGSRLLKDLQVKKNNKFVLYVSSYNASERAVNHWLKTRFKGDYVEFIERIPYEETRNYVKLVLRNYINYRRQLSEEEFSFPENFFTSKLL